jgi:hypothetical protein
MSHKLKFSIEVEIGFNDNEYALEVQNRFIKALIADVPERISFEELEKLLCFSGRQYYVKSVDFSELNRNAVEADNRLEIEDAIKIEIRG